jgi:hypothetical protein
VVAIIAVQSSTRAIDAIAAASAAKQDTLGRLAFFCPGSLRGLIICKGCFDDVFIKRSSDGGSFFFEVKTLSSMPHHFHAS